MVQNVKLTFYLKKNVTDDQGRYLVMAQLSGGKHSTTAFSAKLLAPAALRKSGRALLLNLSVPTPS